MRSLEPDPNKNTQNTLKVTCLGGAGAAVAVAMITRAARVMITAATPVMLWSAVIPAAGVSVPPAALPAPAAAPAWRRFMPLFQHALLPVRCYISH